MATYFEKSVWLALLLIPKGKITTYKEVAKYIETNGIRAVGRAIAKNPFAPQVPCHRVVKSNKEVGNYSSKRGDLEKIFLLVQENIKIENKKIIDFENVLYRYDDVQKDLIITSSNNLLLTKMQNQYLPFLEAILSNKEITKYSFKNIQNKKEFIKKNFTYSSNYGFAPIIKRDLQKIIGFGGILPFDKNSYELGYVIDKQYWGQGYGIEIAKAQILYIKIMHPNLRIVATTHPNNIYSKNILIKLGFTFSTKIYMKNRGIRELYLLNS